MDVGKIESPGDECFRCGYDLRGIANDRPCPECGLAAERSRRVTDELHETRPKWLRTITAGAFLALLSILVTVAWPFCALLVGSSRPYRHSDWHWVALTDISGFGAAAMILLGGTMLLTRSEGYPVADRADRWQRRWLRLAALVPLVAFAIVCVTLWRTPYVYDSPAIPTMLAVSAAAASPITLLLFFRLRGLAKRARSAHLAEHCGIVGIGATAAVLCLAAEVEITHNAERFGAALGLASNWELNSTAALVILVVVTVAACLFLLWSIYLLLRFVIAFALAARQASRKWRRDDHSLPSA